MHNLSSGLRWWFETLDNARRRRGALMDRLGYAPHETPSEIVLEIPGLRLRRYASPVGMHNAALIVPAPIKRHYIWDLAPECSVVQRVLQSGIVVYLIEWVDPTEAEAGFGLEEYGNTLIGQCIAAIRALRTAQAPDNLFLLAHSLGGVLATIYTALHPEQVSGLVVVEGPLHFGSASGSFTPLVAFGPRGDSISRLFPRVPGSVLSLTSVVASPSTFQFERGADFLASLGSSHDLRTHMMVERWTLDEAPMPGKLFEEVVERLYRDDQLMRGTLSIGGQRIGPAQVRSPLLAVYDPRSVVVPPDSIVAFYDVAGSSNRKLLVYQGDTGIALSHVGALMGRNAHRHLWPEIIGWMNEIGATRH